MTLAAAETENMVAMLRSLTGQDWAQPTDCPDWDVRAVAGHVLGMVEGFTGTWRMASMLRAGAKFQADGPLIDGVTAMQVATNARLSTSDVIDRMATGGPRQARWRCNRPLLRRVSMKQPYPDANTIESWSMGYLFEQILTRDTWMHRVDVSRATGRTLELTPEHDGRIIADVVAEWARRHGKPFTLRLTGPAGGTYTGGTGGEELSCDAIEFCRILSGRGTGPGLLARPVPF
ncbi:MAG: maleylpyruvate isomerase family mycothiol-dependent enzyme [Pseudonocardiales bacterium]|nr:maleylpyruvate isomerase family mycothiol-dependent enzyme [Pseudonocardiales bacterium]